MSLSFNSILQSCSPTIDLSPVFPFLIKNLTRIQSDPRMFWTVLPGCKCGFCYGGSFEVPIEIWAMAWEMGLGIRSCPECGSTVYFILTNGAMSLGWSKGYCSICGNEWHGNVEGYSKSSVPKYPKIHMTRYWDEKVRQRISGTSAETVR